MEGKYTTKNVAKGLEYLERGAEEGNLESLIYLSKLYREGTDLPRSIVKANAYLTQAAERGSSDAIKKLEERESEDLLSCTASNR
ncbi:Sel1 repeat protein [compost metagenome]